MTFSVIYLIFIASVSAQSSPQASPRPPSGMLRASLPDGVIAIVNGTPIARADLDDAVQRSGQPDTPQLRQNLKQLLITREVLRQDAEGANYGAKSEVQQAMITAKMGTETQLYLKDNVHPKAVSDNAIKARYDAITASLGRVEYKSSLISVHDATTAAMILRELKAHKRFDELARQYSADSSAQFDGELPWVSFRVPVVQGQTQGLSFPIAQALAALQVGAVTTEPLRIGDMFVIVKLDAQRPTQPPSFDQVKGSLRQQLQAEALREATDQFVSGRVKQASIQQ
ncbi:peptidylprolyl isomerase [Trinickia acidisoli]|uniref:peptidylprolyl isomerase n=1 Tax=Trinickia acidisoli TaxID=2767482 RepID=UPI002852EA5F|nr:peptidylprolyl isomerase [Trinickia acidisoli]